METVSSKHDGRQERATAFDYMYRDAGNFKAWGTVMLLGEISADDQIRIRRTLEAEEFFVPEQIGLPPLQEKLFAGGKRTRSDHAWHTFGDFRPIQGGLDGSHLWGTVADLVTAFENVEEWDVLSSAYS